jgi:hypothetical protein
MKNKIKVNILLCFLLVIANQVTAQVPGYLGKRFAIGYAFTAVPFASVMGDIRNTDGSSMKISNLNTRHNLELNFVIKEHAFLAFNYSYQTWGVVSNVDNGNFNEMNSNFGFKNNLKRDFGVTDFKYINAVSHKYSLLAGFTKGIAPRGNYTAVGLSMEQITPQITDINDNVSEIPSINNLGMVLRFGKRRVLYDKLLLDVSANMELGFGFESPNTYRMSERNFEGATDSYNSTLSKNDLYNKAKFQSTYYSLLSIRLGLYYLL